MIGAIMILAVVAYLVWTFWGRAFHVIGQYKKGGSQFKLSEPLDYEAIYQKLKEELQYPDNRNLFYDEFGQPSIAGRYGTYTIHTEDTLLTVQACIMLLQLASIGLNSLCIFSNPAVNATNCSINTVCSAGQSN